MKKGNKRPYETSKKAMFRNMVTSLFKYERIQTTGAKAKELRRWADHVITLAKRGDLHARRRALAIVREKGVVHKLFKEVNERFGNSAGGYTRIVKLGRRTGDAAHMSLVELVVAEVGGKKKAKKKASKTAAAKKKSEREKKTEAQEEKKEPTEKEEKAEVKGASSKKAEAKAKPVRKKKAGAVEKEEKLETKPGRTSKKKDTKDE
jgi:large subunit ribosomal protein L17